MSAILNAGTRAPDFSLGVAPDKKLTLSELRGKPVILAFYPADWRPVCATRWRCTTKYCRCSGNKGPSIWDLG